jgi:hypothetical protein
MRGKRWTRNAIALHLIPPALEEATRQRTKAGSRRSARRSPRTLRYACIASVFAAGAEEYVASRSGTRT